MKHALHRAWRSPAEALAATTTMTTTTTTVPLHITGFRVGQHDGADRVVVELAGRLRDADHDVREVDDVGRSGGFGPAYSVDAAPDYDECTATTTAVDAVSYVNLVVPSDHLGSHDVELPARVSSPETVKVGEVIHACGPYEGRVYLAIVLRAPGEVTATVLDDPARVVLDIR